MELSEVKVARMLVVLYGYIEKSIRYHKVSFLSPVKDIPHFARFLRKHVSLKIFVCSAFFF